MHGEYVSQSRKSKTHNTYQTKRKHDFLGTACLSYLSLFYMKQLYIKEIIQNYI